LLEISPINYDFMFMNLLTKTRQNWEKKLADADSVWEKHRGPIWVWCQQQCSTWGQLTKRTKLHVSRSVIRPTASSMKGWVPHCLCPCTSCRTPLSVCGWWSDTASTAAWRMRSASSWESQTASAQYAPGAPSS